MAEPFIGEIRMFAGNFAPRGWALCDGQLLAISQNDALFSLLGTTYGGDGRSTFGLPDMRGRLPIHADGGHRLGQRAGSEQVNLTANQLPAHSHSLSASSNAAASSTPAENVTAASSSNNLYGAENPVSMDAAMLSNSGGGQAHDNVMPFLCLNFIIALFGIFPSRT